jgi:hypothetical protein
MYDNLQIYKSDNFSLIPMSYKYTTTALYAAVIASVLVASVFAISYIQEALAQGNQTGGGNQTSSNNTSGAAGSNRASGNATGGGTAANPAS